MRSENILKSCKICYIVGALVAYKNPLKVLNLKPKKFFLSL